MRNFVDLELEIIQELDNSLLVSDGDKQVYLPKSMISYVYAPKNMVGVQLPEWLAHKKGLI